MHARATRIAAVSNPDRVLWPETGTTKAELVEYYADVAPVLLPHLTGRAVTLRRFPDGVDAVGWYQTSCPPGAPEWVRTRTVEGRGRAFAMCLVEDLATLLWGANLGTIEFHPFLWRGEDVRPTALVLDLDPGPPAGLPEAAHVGLRLRDLLAGLGLEAFPKTSGAAGLHVYVPLDGEAPFAATKGLARALALTLEAEEPELVIAAQRRSLRRGKVLVDWLQNDAWRSTVAAYSLRALPWPTVSTPVAWNELEEAVAAERPELLLFEPADVLERIQRLGDVFRPVLELRQALPRSY